MAEVEAIKDRDKVQLISHLLEIRCSKQMAEIWGIGLNLALRISDLLSIKFSDITDERLILIEGKTGKRAEIKLNNKVQILINDIRLRHPSHRFLFQSYRNQQSLNREARPLTRKAVAKAFKIVGDELGIRLGTHSMRKSRGYHLFKKTNDITRVMRMLRHNSQSTTLRYIGLTQENVDRDFCELEL